MQITPRPSKKKKIKDLTNNEIDKICKKNNNDCHDCPLAIINFDTVVCSKDILKKEVDVE